VHLVVSYYTNRTLLPQTPVIFAYLLTDFDIQGTVHRDIFL